MNSNSSIVTVAGGDAFFVRILQIYLNHFFESVAVISMEMFTIGLSRYVF